MKTKFILDRFKEQDRKQLEFIKKIINEKPSKVNENALFLRKFILAILHHYNKNLKIKEESFTPVIEHNLPQAPSKLKLDFRVPQAPSPIKLDIRLEAPEKLEL